MTYDPGADALARYPQFKVRWRRGLPVPGLVAPGRRVILIDRDLPHEERREALAHELAHLDLGHGVLIHERQEELRADLLAALRLLPLNELAECLRWALGPDEVADHFGVTPRLVRLRLKHLSMQEMDFIEGVTADEIRGIA